LIIGIKSVTPGISMPKSSDCFMLYILPFEYYNKNYSKDVYYVKKLSS
jgi:hypothetical protein